jgi:hypothetical protein
MDREKWRLPEIQGCRFLLLNLIHDSLDRFGVLLKPAP